MSVSLQPKYLRRYRDIARLLIKYGRSDLVREMHFEGLEFQEHEVPQTADAIEFAHDLERLGPTFIKLGQLLSTRVDLLPTPYIEALARLQDDVAPFPYSQVEEIVNAELGIGITRAFESFDQEPLAAASLAQVHRARTKTGREVVVKVQRPDIRTQIADDMVALAEIASFLDDHTETGRRIGFTELLEEFRKALIDELDFGREAQNLSRLNAIIKPWPRLVVPQPVADYTSGRVLTMDYLAGHKVTNLSPLIRTDYDFRPLVDDLFRAYLQQILAEGFFHADPHPGNILLLPDQRLALIDLGMVARLSESLREAMVKLLLAVSEGNGEEAARILADLGDPRDDFDTDRFHAEVAELVQRSIEVGSEVQVGTAMLEMMRIATQNGLRPPSKFSLVGKALLNLDQIATILDPTFNPTEAIKRHSDAIFRSRASTSTAGLFSALLETRDFAVQLPGRVNKVMDAVADGKFHLKIDSLDEPQWLAVLQRLTNRLASGIVLASLVVGAALMMQIPTKSRIFGYPSIAMVCFALAAAGGFMLLFSVVLADRRIANTARRQRKVNKTNL